MIILNKNWNVPDMVGLIESDAVSELKIKCPDLKIEIIMTAPPRGRRAAEGMESTRILRQTLKNDVLVLETAVIRDIK